MIVTPWHIWRKASVEAENYSYRYTTDAALLKKLNASWRQAHLKIPHWRSLVSQGRVPAAFASWEEYRTTMPIMYKSNVVVSPERYFSERIGSTVTWSKTGGTIAEPLSFPVSRAELSRVILNEWLLRQWSGISPFSRQFKIWGHSHIFSGKDGDRTYKIRRLKDALLGMTRLSAYDLSDDKLTEIVKQLRRTSCDFVMSYSRCLEAIAAKIESSKSHVSYSVKAVIATSECFSSEEAEAHVASSFGAPVFMEYGSAETGPIAFRGPDKKYRVAWRKFWLEAIPVDGTAYRLLITAIGERYFPLFRYEIGDLIAEPDKVEGLRSFESVKGRVNEIVTLTNGNKIHSEAITHALRGISGLKQFQYVINKSGGLSIRIQAEFSASERQGRLMELKKNLAIVDMALGNVEIIVNEGLLVSKAGKRPLVYFDDSR